MKKTFYIFDHFFLPTPYNHRFFVEKFSKGFVYNGWDVEIVNKISDITNPGIVMISNHNFSFSFGDRCKKNNFIIKVLRKTANSFFIRKIANSLRYTVIKKLAKQLRNKDITLIAWFWFSEEKWLNTLGIPIIHTGEFLYKELELESHKKWYDFYNSKYNALPIKFAADIDPVKIGEDCLNEKINVSYVGNKEYKKEWLNLFKDDKNYTIIGTPPFIKKESDRIEIYKNSKISLGFHAEENIENGIVVERVFESLAYGAICITDNPSAQKATDNNVILVKNKKELIEKINYYINNQQERLALRKNGFVFTKNNGTYYHQAKLFIEKSESLLTIHDYDKK